MFREAEDTGRYETFQQAQFGFEEALALWPENTDAMAGLEDTRRNYAEAALTKEDLDLAASLVPEGEVGWAPFAELVNRLRRRRDARRKRIRYLSRLAALLTAAVLLVLGIATVLVSREKNRVVVAEVRASEQRNLALQALDTLVFSVNDSLEDRPAMEGLRKSILDQAIASLSNIAETQTRDPLVDRRLGIAYQSMARIFQAARRHSEATEYQERAVSVFESLRSGEGSDRADQDLVVALSTLGEIVSNYRMGDLEAAGDHYERALSITERLLQRGVCTPALRVLRAGLLRDLGDLDFDRGDLKAAQEHYRLFMVEARGLAETEVPGSESKKLYSEALTRLGDLHSTQNENDEAYAIYQRALRIDQELAADDPDSFINKRLLGLAQFNVADIARKAGKFGPSAEHYEQTRRIQTELVNTDPSNGTYRRDLLATEWGLGELTRDQGRSAEALVHYEEALRVAEDLLNLNPGNLEARRDLFICCKEVGSVYQAQGLLAKARAAFERGLGLCRSIVKDEPENTGAWTDVVVALSFLADLESAAGKPDEARRALGEGLEILSDLDAEGRLPEGSPFRAWSAELEAAIAKLP